MNVAKVSADYQCPVFENRPHAELISAIDLMIKEVTVVPECSGAPSAKTIEENGKTLKESLAAIQAVMQSQDAATVNPAQIEQTMTSALGAISNLGSVINNNEFLNSKCGRQSMSTGKVLLAVNDIINGFSPYALFAVSMNAALAPALPFVIGGVVASAGISAVAKMIDSKTLEMDIPEHRKAVLQNTCQYTKIAAKVRFMQLAQSGRIKTITQELEKRIDLYKQDFGAPSNELRSLLNYRDSKSKYNLAIENQYKADRNDLSSVETQMGKDSDDLMVCTLATELATWAKDGKTFPTSAFANLEAAASQSERAVKLQSASLKALNLTSMKRITDASAKAYEDEASLKTCAQAGRSWIAGVRQAITMTYELTNKSRNELETELSSRPEYTRWKAQFNRIQTERVTISRVEKAMEELAKDTSVIDRSELDQRMRILKSGLFGSRSAWGFGKPPVLAWINHTKKIHDQAVAALSTGMATLRDSAYTLTAMGRGGAVNFGTDGKMRIDYNIQYDSYTASQNLATFNKSQLPVGSRENEIACQQLESAWLDWSASLDHLGAIQLFCNMIDPVLDPKMDSSVLEACRGNVELNGTVVSKSLVDGAVSKLVTKGFQKDAKLLNEKMEELECPLPPVSVMNE
ncbi:hypothetical protein AZI86_08585 [Bdellovibrio bacteriovorus]|uniref:Uncharacterized protein n=2 Tax=Bdellovibrio bacteriovorus TaxID=959 RepID=A0A150WTB4_BDEBC|nr:hypothetical protein AZI86_08585 [Bdellovibrio bacteriovorus]